MGVSTFRVLSFLYSFVNAILTQAWQRGGNRFGGRQALGRKDKAELAAYFGTGIKINVVASTVIYGVLCAFSIVKLYQPCPDFGTYGAVVFKHFRKQPFQRFLCFFL